MWTVHIPKRVEKELLEVPPGLKETIDEALEKLHHDPFPAGSKKLKGRLNARRIRVRTYRVLYDISQSNHCVIILKIGSRNESTYRFH